MTTKELHVSEDKAAIDACVKKIAKAIGKESPAVVAAACLLILEFSVEMARVIK